MVPWQGVNYFVYILTNPNRTTLYVGMTNDLVRILWEHEQSAGNRKSFTGRYHCNRLVWYETHYTAQEAIDREKEIKKWSRDKKESLIHSHNPDWKFMNDMVRTW